MKNIVTCLILSKSFFEARSLLMEKMRGISRMLAGIPGALIVIACLWQIGCSPKADVPRDGKQDLEIAIHGKMDNKMRTELPAFPLIITNLTYPARQKVIHPAISLIFYTNQYSWHYSKIPLKETSYKEILAMSESNLIALLPRQVGLSFVPCPNCDLNAAGDGWIWDINNPNVFICEYCKHSFPSAKYPANAVMKVTAPSGRIMQYPYYTQTNGTKYFLNAKLDYLKCRYFERAAFGMAMHYYFERDEKYARKAAIILCAFARAFPDFVYKRDDWQAQETLFHNGEPPPEDAADTSRATRWSHWTYMDIPSKLLYTYDLICGSRSFQEYVKETGIDPQKIIENDFFIKASEASLKMRELYHNMSPCYWQDLITCSKVTGMPIFEQIALSRMSVLLKTSFYADGCWKEPAGGYIDQMMGLMGSFMEMAGEANAQKIRPFYERAKFNLEANTYPNGSALPMADTWMHRPAPKQGGKEQASYLQGGIGHAMLGTPLNGNQIQLHMLWTPDVLAHPHRDTLGIMLWANKKEVLSDIGYSYTKYRGFTYATASHNLVVIDGANLLNAVNGEYARRADITYMDKDNPYCQIIDVDGKRANNGNPYRRTMFLIQMTNDQYYIADFFGCGGGAQYDYFLHGNCEQEDAVSITDVNDQLLSLSKAELYPSAKLGKWQPPEGPADINAKRIPYNAYGYFLDIKALPGAKETKTCVAQFIAPDKTGLAIHIPKNSGYAAVYTGKSAALRQCGVSDNTLINKIFRRFIMIRKETGEKQDVLFQTILEPFAGRRQVLNAEALAEGIVAIRHAQGVDILFAHINTNRPVSVDGLDFKVHGEYGYISIAQQNIRRFHLVNAGFSCGSTTFEAPAPPVGKVLRTEEENTLYFTPLKPKIKKEDLAPFIALNFPRDARYNNSDSRYGYFVSAFDANSGKISVENTLGFSVSEQDAKCDFLYFPLHSFDGPPDIVFFARKTR